MGAWSIWTTLSMFSIPEIARWAPGFSIERYRLCASERYRMSFTSVDFPEPETPVTTVSRPSGIETSTFFRLWPCAPRMAIALPLGERRVLGTPIFMRPERYWPVSDGGFGG